MNSMTNTRDTGTNSASMPRAGPAVFAQAHMQGEREREGARAGRREEGEGEVEGEGETERKRESEPEKRKDSSNGIAMVFV